MNIIIYIKLYENLVLFIMMSLWIQLQRSNSLHLPQRRKGLPLRRVLKVRGHQGQLHLKEVKREERVLRKRKRLLPQLRLQNLNQAEGKTIKAE